MKIKLAALGAVVALLCFACNNSSETTQELKSLDKENAPINQKAGQDFETADSTKQIEDTIVQSPQGTPAISSSKPINWEKKIVKTAQLNTEVKDYKLFSQQLNDKIKMYGGYISGEEQTQSDYKIENSVVIKIPVDQFQIALEDFTKGAIKINEKKVTSEDVATQLIDGKSRLEAKKQVRLRYLDLLKQAKNMEEILTVQKEINDIQEEIETVNGRINFLNLSTVMSTINFTYSQILNASAKAPDEAETGFLGKLKTAFIKGWCWIEEVFIGLTSVWPLLALIILGIWFFKKKQMPKMKINSDPS